MAAFSLAACFEGPQGLQAHRDLQGRKDRKASKVLRDREAIRAKKVLRDGKALRAQRANKAPRAQPVPLVWEVHPVPPEGCMQSAEIIGVTPPAIANSNAAPARNWFL